MSSRYPPSFFPPPPPHGKPSVNPQPLPQVCRAAFTWIDNISGKRVKVQERIFNADEQEDDHLYEDLEGDGAWQVPPATLNTKHWTLKKTKHPTLNAQRYTLNTKHSTPKTTHSTLNTKHQTQNPKPQTLNPKPCTSNPSWTRDRTTKTGAATAKSSAGTAIPTSAFPLQS